MTDWPTMKNGDRLEVETKTSDGEAPQTVRAELKTDQPEKVSDIGGGDKWDPDAEQLLDLQNTLAVARAELRTTRGQVELYRAALFACIKVLEHYTVHGVDH